MVDGVVVERLGGRIGSKALIREINEAFVLDVVRRRGTTSRAEITSITGLSPATVTGISAQLVRDGLLRETDVLRGTGGRPARLLELGTDAVVAAGVRLSRESVEVALVDLRGEVITTLTESLAATDPVASADGIAAAVSALLGRHPDSALRGVSIALSGVVDRPRGVVRHSGALGWQNVPFAAMVAERVQSRVVIDSLVNSFATGLLLLDPDLAERDVIVFSVGTSLGASLLVNGRIHRGHQGGAGGFAHSTIGSREGGSACHCGNVGCLETTSSIWGIQRELESRGPAVIASPEAAEVLHAGGALLGKAIANAAKMFGPERVVLVLAEELADSSFETACLHMLAAEYTFGDCVLPDVVSVRADTGTFARGAGYDMISELFRGSVGASA